MQGLTRGVSLMPTGPKGQKRPADVIGNAVKVMRIATGDGSPINSQNGKSPLPGGQARRNKLLVSWGPLVIGTVRVAFCNAATVGFPVAKMTSGASATNSFAYRRWRSALPASQRNPHIAAIGPAQLLQRLQER